MNRGRHAEASIRPRQEREPMGDGPGRGKNVGVPQEDLEYIPDIELFSFLVPTPSSVSLTSWPPCQMGRTQRQRHRDTTGKGKSANRHATGASLGQSNA